MGLRLKFNLVLMVVFAAGLATSATFRASCCRGTRATRCCAAPA